MCKYWEYGCGHSVRTKCPRPKPGASSNQSTPSRQSSSSTSSTTQQTQITSNNHGILTIMSPPGSPPRVSKFCNGFTIYPKITDSPCYACIQADARQKVAQEAPEVEKKKEELKKEGYGRTIARGPDGSYTDEFGRKIVAEDAFYQEESYGRQRGFSGQRGRGNGNGNARGNGYGTGLDPALEYGNGRQHGFTDGDGGGAYGAFGRRGGFSGASASGNGSGFAGQYQSGQDGYAQSNGYIQQTGYAQGNRYAQQSTYGGHGPGYGRGGYSSNVQSQQAYGNGNTGERAWGNNNGFGQSLNGYGEEPYNGNHY